MRIEFNEVIDLTIPIVSGVDLLPTGLKRSGHPVDFSLFRTIEKDNIQVGIFSTPIHSGTHLDAPRHVVPGGKTMDEIPLESWMGHGYCVDVSFVKPNEVITIEMLAPHENEICSGTVLFLYTGWNEKMFPSLEYWNDSPTLSPEAANWVINRGIKLLGYDFFQDAGAKGFTNDPKNFALHQAVLLNGALHIEHLTNLSKLVGSKFFAISLPLNITGAEGSPTRAIALR